MLCHVATRCTMLQLAVLCRNTLCHVATRCTMQLAGTVSQRVVPCCIAAIHPRLTAAPAIRLSPHGRWRVLCNGERCADDAGPNFWGCHVACCMLHASCVMLHVACFTYMSHASVGCRMLHVVWYMLHVACCMSHVRAHDVDRLGLPSAVERQHSAVHTNPRRDSPCCKSVRRARASQR